MSSPLDHLSAISLFVDDLSAAKTFYRDVLGMAQVFADESSAAFSLGRLIINLLHVDNAQEIVAPGLVGSRDAGSRFQLSVWVDDVDAVCAQLARRGLELLAGPLDRPWGMRTANFIDPAGHSWEIAQRL